MSKILKQTNEVLFSEEVFDMFHNIQNYASKIDEDFLENEIANNPRLPNCISAVERIFFPYSVRCLKQNPSRHLYQFCSDQDYYNLPAYVLSQEDREQIKNKYREIFLGVFARYKALQSIFEEMSGIVSLYGDNYAEKYLVPFCMAPSVYQINGLFNAVPYHLIDCYVRTDPGAAFAYIQDYHRKFNGKYSNFTSEVFFPTYATAASVYAGIHYDFQIHPDKITIQLKNIVPIKQPLASIKIPPSGYMPYFAHAVSQEEKKFLENLVFVYSLLASYQNTVTFVSPEEEEITKTLIKNLRDSTNIPALYKEILNRTATFYQKYQSAFGVKKSFQESRCIETSLYTNFQEAQDFFLWQIFRVEALFTSLLRPYAFALDLVELEVPEKYEIYIKQAEEYAENKNIFPSFYGSGSLSNFIGLLERYYFKGLLGIELPEKNFSYISK